MTSVLLLCSLAYCASFLIVSEAVGKTNNFIFCVRYLLFSLVFMIPFVVMLLLSGRVLAAFPHGFFYVGVCVFFCIYKLSFALAYKVDNEKLQPCWGASWWATAFGLRPPYGSANNRTPML